MKAEAFGLEGYENLIFLKNAKQLEYEGKFRESFEQYWKAQKFDEGFEVYVHKVFPKMFFFYKADSSNSKTQIKSDLEIITSKDISLTNPDNALVKNFLSNFLSILNGVPCNPENTNAWYQEIARRFKLNSNEVRNNCLIRCFGRLWSQFTSS